MLTENKLRALKPKDKKYFVCDGDFLYLSIAPSGNRAWIYRQQARADGTKAFKKTLGYLPEMDLYSARQARDKLKQELRQERMQRGGNNRTFREVAEEWLERYCRKNTSERNSRREESRLNRFVYPVIGDLTLAQIEPAQVLSIAKGLEDQGYTDLPHDVLQLVGRVFRYAVANLIFKRDITADIRDALAPRKNEHMASLETPEEVGGLLRALDSLPESSTKWCMQFIAYTFVRSTEARKATWKEFDLERARWKIPGERMKKKRPHIVPLSKQVVELLKKAKMYCQGSAYCFPSPRTTAKPLSENALIACLRRMGYTKEEMTTHGWRSIASTTLNENGWYYDAIERQMSHDDRDEVRAAYNYAQFLSLRIPMMQWYADYLDALRDGKPVPEVPKFTIVL